MTFFAETKTPLVFGHRGLNTAHPENTLEAIEHAARCGARGVEIDVRLCHDNTLVVFHDSTLERMTGGADSRCVSELNLEQVQAVALRGDYRVPTLDEVLDCCQRLRLKLNVELKCDGPERWVLAQRSARSLGSQLQTSVLVSSFDPLLLLTFQGLCPQIETGLLIDKEGAGPTFARLSHHFPSRAICAHHSLIDAGQLRRWHRAGKAVVAWTVNDEAEQERLRRLGVAAIICDDPCALVSKFSRS